MDKMLSDNEVLMLAGSNAGLITYPELSKIRSIGELFARKPKWVLMYQMEQQGDTISGLRTGFTKIGHQIHFFDSYSGKEPLIDNVLDDIPKEYAKESGQDHTWLSDLFRKSPYEIHYNEHQYQKYGKGINTCGRHVGMFLCSGMTTDQYWKCMCELKRRSGAKDFDELVVDMTQPTLG